MRLPAVTACSVLGIVVILLAGCGAGSEFVAVGAEIEATPTTASAPGAAPATTASPLATVPVTAASSTASALARYSAGWFTISLPGEPTVDRQAVPSAAGPIEVTIVSVVTSNSAYGVAYNSEPLLSIDLDGAARGAASAVRGRLTDLKPITYKGRRGRDFRVVGAEGGVATVFGRVIEVDRRALQIQAVFKGGHLKAPPDSTYSQMLASVAF